MSHAFEPTRFRIREVDHLRIAIAFVPAPHLEEFLHEFIVVAGLVPFLGDRY
jgi:hypothetical protein